MLSFNTESLLLVNIAVTKQDRSETGLCIHDNGSTQTGITLHLASYDWEASFLFAYGKWIG